MSLRVAPLLAEEAAALEASPPEGLLALVRFGVPARETTASLPLPLLNASPAAEAWFGSGPVARRTRGPFSLADDGVHLFLHGAAGDAAGEPLEERTREIYRALLATIEEEGFPHLLRAWNVVSGINAETRGLERYRLFSRGRADAFGGAWGPSFEERLPACSAVGGRSGGLVVHALAGKLPGSPVENPEQVSAYRYPDRYGPRSPTFSRGLRTAPGAGLVFVSGTASILGHESVHVGDPVRQTEVTLENIERVLDEAAVPGRGVPLGARMTLARVYLRRKADLEAVRGAYARKLGAPLPTVWLEADVCREELLVEIEGVAEV